jgi:class 3 adenylate cyclase
LSGSVALNPQPQRVILVEPDPALREWCRLHLEAQKLAVWVFGEVRPALQAARLDPPDLLIVATDLPGGGGFALVAALRSSLRTALVPVLFLVPSHDAQAHALALSIEPGWIVTKPIARDVLLKAIGARLQSANQVASGRERYQPGTMAGAERAGERASGRTGLVLETRQASVLVVALRNFVSLARAVSAKPLDAMLRRFIAAVSEVVAEQQGWIVRADATRLVILFEDGPKTDRHHAIRALAAALDVLLAARQAKRADHPDGLAGQYPDLSVGCGVHTGEVVIARLPGGGQLALTLAGPTAEVAQRLDGRAKGLGWSIAATEPAVLASAGRYHFGRSATLTDTDHDVTLAISEVLGFNPGFARPGELQRMAEVREAVLANTMLAGLAGDIDQVSADKTIMVSASRRPKVEGVPDLPGRRLTRRIGGGSRVSAYLAVHAATGREEVVKFVRGADATPAFRTAYLDLYRKIATLEQRNVVTVYEVGETVEGGFAALELLSGGHLLDAIRQRLPIGQALKCLAEMCFALDAIHALGHCHGALRAEHFRFRHDGVVVLADFNATAHSAGSVGEAAVVDGSARHDFRAVGFVLYAMLTGDVRDIHASADRSGAVLRLPLPLSPLQPCLDGLMGGVGEAAFERAEDVLVELLALKHLFPFDIQQPAGFAAG